MFTYSLAFVLALGASAVTPEPLAPLPHVRPLDPLAGTLLTTGSRESTTFASLIGALDRSSGLVVYVTTTTQLDPRGSIVFVSRAANITYLLVRVGTRQTDTDRLAVLAHELTHAVEIARSGPVVTSQAQLRRLYTCIGIDSSGKRLESDAAVRTERAVHRELGRTPGEDPVDLIGSSPSIRAGHGEHE